MAAISLILAAALLAQGEPAQTQPEASENIAAAPPAVQDPEAWWAPTIPRTPVEADPLLGRRLRRGETPPVIDNGVAPLLYRLWNLSPLQSQIVRRGEIILEVWARPSRGVRQAVSRVVVRSDGRVFVQARAGFGCCAPEILRRIDINAELPRSTAQAVRAAAADPVWTQPRDVTVDYGGGAVAAICVNGIDFDLTLVTPGRTVTIRRACDDPEVGSAATALRAALAPVLGRDPRFDYLFPRGADFTAEAAAYQGLIAAGGALRPATQTRPEPPPPPPPLDDEQADETPEPDEGDAELAPYASADAP